ncbi:MAG: tRNA (N(6)-L-threonylcarbamoyladenosine(37)-C(2))-methylthiotransferase MtaB [Spirochaeta sp.]|nr:tRNA (N(6)-L-threonylcarbamoyladenosine(37)-C(2))-methylthiotransferase MtaB [Spirochaeta sp.]
MHDSTTPTVAFETLGCKLNQYESDSIATVLRDRGYRIVPFDTPADAYIVNSCTVTNKADRKSRNTVYRARRAGGTPAVVILTGCFTESRARAGVSGDRIADPTRGATYTVDNAHKNTIPDLIEAHLRGEIPDQAALAPDVFGFSTPGQIFHTRTNIKVQDGCDNFCTFCIIPFVRGRATSRPPDDVLREAREAIAGGSHELVLTGVNMSRYRFGEEVDFTALVERILSLPGDYRVRISSLEPDQLTDRFVSLFAHPRMVPHLHLCAQSGSERILLKMRRMYTAEEFRRVVHSLRAVDPRFNITTDIIVGFPGETDADVATTLALLTDLQIGHVHTFPFSLRNGTRAERMDGQIPGPVIAERARAIRNHSEQEKRRYRSGLIGTRERVLVERLDETPGDAVMARGLGACYVPVRFPASPEVVHPNTFHTVDIVGIADGNDPDLIGQLVTSS